MAVIDKPLSNIQLELLKLYSQDIDEKDLLAIKKLLAKYFAEKASDEMDRLWDKNSWSDDTMDKWLNEG